MATNIKNSVVINAEDIGGRNVSKSITNTKPGSLKSDLRGFAQELNNLTTNTYKSSAQVTSEDLAAGAGITPNIKLIWNDQTYGDNELVVKSTDTGVNKIADNVYTFFVSVTCDYVDVRLLGFTGVGASNGFAQMAGVGNGLLCVVDTSVDKAAAAEDWTYDVDTQTWLFSCDAAASTTYKQTRINFGFKEVLLNG